MQKIENIIQTHGKYKLSVFSNESIERIEDSIFEENGTNFLSCIIRKKRIQAKPEEIIRQLMIDKLIYYYGYSKDLLRVEYAITQGSSKKTSADIVILNKKDSTVVYCIIEVKQIKTEKKGIDQLKSYINSTGAPLGVWTNGQIINYYEKLDPNHFEPLNDIPKADEDIDSVKKQAFTYLELMQQDRLFLEKKSLKSLIQEMEDEVLANAGVDVFEEAFKLIFTKLYDEMESSDDRKEIEIKLKILKEDFPDLSREELLLKIDSVEFRKLEFRSRGDALVTKEKIGKLFINAKDKWPGIFETGEAIRITDANHLQICVAFLQKVKLFNSNLQVIDEAFEFLVNKSAKGEKGQYFTPRNVVDMCVYMINPQADEYMIDTACGSCGFTVHTLFNVWNKLVKQGKAEFSNFSNQTLTREQKAYVEKVFGIDFDEKSVRVARTLNMIAGDGKTNVLHLNTLDYQRWEEKRSDKAWSKIYNEGYLRLLDLAENADDPKNFNFDIVLANPPFAGDIKDSRLLSKFDIAENNKKEKMSRDILFIERNLQFLKPGGRMAIVLPQGRFNNTTDKHIRNYIMKNSRLIAVIGLDDNTFKPHTGTKTSVLFVQKWHDEINPVKEDYEIFMAVSENSGKDNSGESKYKLKDGERETDEHNHLVLDHDLDKIAYAFEKWAKKQNLSFWKR